MQDTLQIQDNQQVIVQLTDVPDIVSGHPSDVPRREFEAIGLNI
jgi:hypothetical protein